MAKLNRITAKIFGETASTTNTPKEIGQFGSAKAGTYNATGDVATIQNLSAWSNGWIDAVTPTDQFPSLPEMTGVHKVLSYQEAYLLQQGIPEWDSATTYYENSFCSYNGKIYISLADDNLNNNPENDSVNWEAYGAIDDYANQNLQNLTTLGNARLQYAPFAINAGTVVNGNNNTITSGSLTSYYTEPGTYSLEITEAGNYEVEMYGAGAGAAWASWVTDRRYYRSAGGGSGAGYKGVLNLPVGTYTVKVGEGGSSAGAYTSSNTGENGESTQLQGIITVGGGSGGHAASGVSDGGAGGTVIIDDNTYIVSTTLSQSGNSGTGGSTSLSGPPSCDGGASVQDGTQTGRGAGAGVTSGNFYSAANGYLKVTKLTGDASKIYCDPCTVTTADGRTIIDNDGNELSVASTPDGSYHIFKSCIDGSLSLTSSLYISKTLNNWTQPILSANGTMGGGSFAVSGNEYSSSTATYKAFDGNSSSQFQGNAVVSYITFYNPDALNVTKLTIKNGPYQGQSIVEGNIQASNDNTNWTTIKTFTNSIVAASTDWNIDLSTNTNYYKYYKLNSTNTYNNSQGIAEYNFTGLSKITITANTKVDYWLDISTIPANLKIYDTSDWTINNDLVYIGDCSVESGGVTSVSNREFNNSGYTIQKFKDFMLDFDNAITASTTNSDSPQTYLCPDDGIMFITSFSANTSQSRYNLAYFCDLPWVGDTHYLNGWYGYAWNGTAAFSGGCVCLPFKKGQTAKFVIYRTGGVETYSLLYATFVPFKKGGI